MSALEIIIVVVVLTSLTIVGILIGVSIHREATRLRRRHLRRDELRLARLRDEDIAAGHYTRDDVRRITHGSWV